MSDLSKMSDEELRYEVELNLDDMDVKGTDTADLLAELARRLAEVTAERDKLAAEIARRDEFSGCDGCSTGDCPHGSVQQCADAMSKTIQEQSARIAMLETRERQWFDGEQWVELEPDEVKRRREEAGRKLGWTADGVPVVPLDTVWVDPNTDAEVCVGGKIAWYAVGDSGYGVTPTKPVAVSKCYSTPEAARRGEEDGNA